jgi:hypothetical protein
LQKDLKREKIVATQQNNKNANKMENMNFFTFSRTIMLVLLGFVDHFELAGLGKMLSVTGFLFFDVSVPVVICTDY